MLQAFTRNYHDDSAEAGFQFTFYCDVCNDGVKSSFIQSSTYKKRGLMRGIGQGASIVGSLVGGRVSRLGHAGGRATDAFSHRFEGESPEWHKEHEKAFEQCQNESKQHFHRCPSCHKYACDHCWNEDEGMCVKCAPRQEVYVARARAQAMTRNIDEAGRASTVWYGKIESKTTICNSCGKPAGTGRFCNNCGASMDLLECPNCGAKCAQTIRFCNNCGQSLTQASGAAPSGKCRNCGMQNQPGPNFCGGCGNRL